MGHLGSAGWLRHRGLARGLVAGCGAAATGLAPERRARICLLLLPPSNYVTIGLPGLGELMQPRGICNRTVGPGGNPMPIAMPAQHLHAGAERVRYYYWAWRLAARRRTAGAGAGQTPGTMAHAVHCMCLRRRRQLGKPSGGGGGLQRRGGPAAPSLARLPGCAQSIRMWTGSTCYYAQNLGAAARDPSGSQPPRCACMAP